MLLHLERLTGYGFSVDVAAVREVDLQDEGEEEEEEVEYWPLRLLRGPAKLALCSCVTGEGEPPLDLLVGAIACAGSGEIRGIRVQQLRADALTNIEWWLALAENGIGPEGAILIASFIPIMGGLTALDLSSNSLKDEGVSAVCKAIQSNKETKLASLNFKDNGIGPVGSKSVTAMVAVTGSLTNVR